MKSGVIHHNHAFGFKTWDQGLFAPFVEYAAVNVVLKVIQCKQHLFIQSTNNVGSLFTLPINTRLTYLCIAVRSGGFEAETIRPYGYASIGTPCVDSYI